MTAHNSQARAVDLVFLKVQDKHCQVDEEDDDVEDDDDEVEVEVEVDEVDSAVKSTILSSSSESESALTREMTSMI